MIYGYWLNELMLPIISLFFSFFFKSLRNLNNEGKNLPLTAVEVHLAAGITCSLLATIVMMTICKRRMLYKQREGFPAVEKVDHPVGLMDYARYLVSIVVY